MATTFVDIDRARLLDVVTGRSGQASIDWISTRPASLVDQIEVASTRFVGTPWPSATSCPTRSW
jgi:hypothetical protein